MAVYLEERLCKGCGLCVHVCPHTVLEMGNRRNAKGYALVEIVHPDACRPCLLCEINCPDLALCVERKTAS